MIVACSRLRDSRVRGRSAGIEKAQNGGKVRFPHYLRARVQARDDGASGNEKKTMLNPTKTKNNYMRVNLGLN